MPTGQNARGQRLPFGPIVAVGVLAVAGAVGAFVLLDGNASPPPGTLIRADMDASDAAVAAVAQSLEQMNPEGRHISNIFVQRGIRADDGELPSDGELKVMFNLAWRSLDGKPDERRALDTVAAKAVATLFDDHPELTKLRVILKVPKEDLGADPDLGIANGHRSAAKVFSITRAAYETLQPGVAQSNPQALLRLGDYVVRDGDSWRRGY